MGQTNRQTGEILLDGEDISSQPTHRRAQAGLGYVPQGREIIPGFTVEENILMGCFARKDKKKLIPDYVWDLFPMLKEHLKRQGSNLSGGQQQQLAIARALASDPQILLLDEPTEGIQPNVVEQIQSAIRTLNRELGITVVLVEQQIWFAKSIATKFVILEKGSVAAQGAPEELTDELVHQYMTV